jgi:hypothetical protein
MERNVEEQVAAMRDDLATAEAMLELKAMMHTAMTGEDHEGDVAAIEKSWEDHANDLEKRIRDGEDWEAIKAAERDEDDE